MFLKNLRSTNCNRSFRFGGKRQGKIGRQGDQRRLNSQTKVRDNTIDSSLNLKQTRVKVKVLHSSMHHTSHFLEF